MKPLTVLETFAGIGGFSVGLDQVVDHDGNKYFETVAFNEIEKFPRKVLKKNWPGVPIYHDIRDLTHDKLRADGVPRISVITGGFPCQDISGAGKQAGITGARSGLWDELCRLIGEIQPRLAILENVSALASGDNGRWFGRVLGDLAEIGYDCQWHCIPASHYGAPHLRDRIWILCYPRNLPDTGHDERPGRDEPEEGQQPRPGWEARGESAPLHRDVPDDNSSGGRDEQKQGGRQAQTNPVADGEEESMADSESGGLETRSSDRLGTEHRPRGNEGQPEGESGEGHVADPTGFGVQGHWPSGEQIAFSHALAHVSMCIREGGGFPNWEVEPEVGRVVDGLPDRAHQIKGLGNAIVPQIAYCIGVAVVEAGL